MKIKDPEVLLNKKTLKPIQVNKQKDNEEHNTLQGEIPPQIFDAQNSEYLKQKSESISDGIEQFL